MKKLLIFSIFAAIFFVFGCKKDANKFRNVSAMIVLDIGDPAATGCGYTIKIDHSTIYYPVNLSDTYKKDQLKVIVGYHLLTTKHKCGYLPPSTPSNELQEIRIDYISTN